MWEILIFKRFLPLERSNEFQKTRFYKEKSVEDVVTLEPTAQATLRNSDNKNADCQQD
jgi:Trm5-related predicted tRNA methylase